MKEKNDRAGRAILGAMLLDKEAIELAKEQLKPEDFSDDRLKIIFIAITGMSGVVDIVTLTDGLKMSGLLEKAGGVVFISSLLDEVPTSANAQYYIDKIKEGKK